MNYKKFYYCFLFFLGINCFVYAETNNYYDSTIVMVYSTTPDIPMGRLRLEITTTSIIKYANLICNKKENIDSCSLDGEDTQYIGPHNIYDLIPKKFLSDSNYYNTTEYNGSDYKIWACTTIECQSIWNSNTPDRKDKDIDLFLTKIEEILAGKSEYEFKPILAK